MRAGQPLPEIRWLFGPRTLTLAGLAELRVERGLIVAEDAEMRRFLEANGSTLTGQELAVVAAADIAWFAVFSRLPKGERPSWTLESKESDGREVVSHCVSFEARDATLSVELVTEKANYAPARAAFDRMLASLVLHSGPDWRPWTVGGVALSAVAWFVLRRRSAPGSLRGKTRVQASSQRCPKDDIEV